jgi:hypothetical protein
MMSIVILGVIAFPLGNAVISYLQNTDATIARLGESHDAQIAAAYFTQDVSSVGTRDWSGYPFPLQQSVWPAGAVANPCGTVGTTVVQFSRDDISTNSSAPPVAQVRLAYVVETVAGERQLHRVRCTAGSSTAASSVPTSDIVLVHHLDTQGADTAVAAITCSTTCTDAAVPQYITLALTINDPRNTDPAYVVALTGQRRQT